MQPAISTDKARTWVYPTNYPLRQYQFDICREALFSNTLVVLPTGLGKTLIAAVVMYNYFRWYPSGKTIFMAPTRPLVFQQIEACHKITGIPEASIAHLEGSVSASERSRLWRERSVFFCTPQTIQNDIENGICDPRKIVCLVVDEAHRATGNYAYANIVENIRRMSRRFRVLALSATPGADLQKIQTVIENLCISNIEIRFEADPELAPYRFDKQVEVIHCDEGVVPSGSRATGGSGPQLTGVAASIRLLLNAAGQILADILLANGALVPNQQCNDDRHRYNVNMSSSHSNSTIRTSSLFDEESDFYEQVPTNSNYNNHNNNSNQQLQLPFGALNTAGAAAPSIDVGTLNGFVVDEAERYCEKHAEELNASAEVFTCFSMLRVLLECRRLLTQQLHVGSTASECREICLTIQERVQRIVRQNHTRFNEELDNALAKLLQCILAVTDTSSLSSTTNKQLLSRSHVKPKLRCKIEKLKEVLGEHFARRNKGAAALAAQHQYHQDGGGGGGDEDDDEDGEGWLTTRRPAATTAKNSRHLATSSSSSSSSSNNNISNASLAATRVIVFVTYRSTVQSLLAALVDVAGIRANEFVGQSASKSDIDDKGLKQSDQSAVLRRFNSGEINVLVATCIAEEGLDIEEVDLIVLFDVVSSPVRMVQRCGRTGRKRTGRVVMLVSDEEHTSGGGGKGESQKVAQAEENAATVNRILRKIRSSLQELKHSQNNYSNNSYSISNGMETFTYKECIDNNTTSMVRLYKSNPLMVPSDQPLPQCEFQMMQVGEMDVQLIGGAAAATAGLSSLPQQRKAINAPLLATSSDSHISTCHLDGGGDNTGGDSSGTDWDQWKYSVEDHKSVDNPHTDSNRLLSQSCNQKRQEHHPYQHEYKYQYQNDEKKKEKEEIPYVDPDLDWLFAGSGNMTAAAVSSAPPVYSLPSVPPQKPSALLALPARKQSATAAAAAVVVHQETTVAGTREGKERGKGRGREEMERESEVHNSSSSSNRNISKSVQGTTGSTLANESIPILEEIFGWAFSGSVAPVVGREAAAHTAAVTFDKTEARAVSLSKPGAVPVIRSPVTIDLTSPDANLNCKIDSNDVSVESKDLETSITSEELNAMFGATPVVAASAIEEDNNSAASSKPIQPFQSQQKQQKQLDVDPLSGLFVIGVANNADNCQQQAINSQSHSTQRSKYFSSSSSSGVNSNNIIKKDDGSTYSSRTIRSSYPPSQIQHLDISSSPLVDEAETEAAANLSLSSKSDGNALTLKPTKSGATFTFSSVEEKLLYNLSSPPNENGHGNGGGSGSGNIYCAERTSYGSNGGDGEDDGDNNDDDDDKECAPANTNTSIDSAELASIFGFTETSAKNTNINSTFGVAAATGGSGSGLIDSALKVAPSQRECAAAVNSSYSTGKPSDHDVNSRNATSVRDGTSLCTAGDFVDQSRTADAMEKDADSYTDRANLINITIAADQANTTAIADKTKKKESSVKQHSKYSYASFSSEDEDENNCGDNDCSSEDSEDVTNDNNCRKVGDKYDCHGTMSAHVANTSAAKTLSSGAQPRHEWDAVSRRSDKSAHSYTHVASAAATCDINDKEGEETKNDTVGNSADLDEEMIYAERVMQLQLERDQDEEGTWCAVCLDWQSVEDDPIVFCDGGFCGGAGMHTSCYGITGGRDALPEGDFYCELCAEMKDNRDLVLATESQLRRQAKKDKAAGIKRKKSAYKCRVPIMPVPHCYLCDCAGGLMRRSLPMGLDNSGLGAADDSRSHTEWVHMVCVLFHPLLGFQPDTMRVDNLALVAFSQEEEEESFCPAFYAGNKTRGEKVAIGDAYKCCSLCGKLSLGCVRCAAAEKGICRCDTYFHPYCAYNARLQMIVREREVQQQQAMTRSPLIPVASSRGTPQFMRHRLGGPSQGYVDHSRNSSSELVSHSKDAFGDLGVHEERKSGNGWDFEPLNNSVSASTTAPAFDYEIYCTKHRHAYSLKNVVSSRITLLTEAMMLQLRKSKQKKKCMKEGTGERQLVIPPQNQRDVQKQQQQQQERNNNKGVYRQGAIEVVELSDGEEEDNSENVSNSQLNIMGTGVVVRNRHTAGKAMRGSDATVIDKSRRNRVVYDDEEENDDNGNDLQSATATVPSHAINTTLTANETHQGSNKRRWQQYYSSSSSSSDSDGNDDDDDEEDCHSTKYNSHLADEAGLERQLAAVAAEGGMGDRAKKKKNVSVKADDEEEDNEDDHWIDSSRRSDGRLLVDHSRPQRKQNTTIRNGNDFRRKKEEEEVVVEEERQQQQQQHGYRHHLKEANPRINGRHRKFSADVHRLFDDQAQESDREDSSSSNEEVRIIMNKSKRQRKKWIFNNEYNLDNADQEDGEDDDDDEEEEDEDGSILSDNFISYTQAEYIDDDDDDDDEEHEEEDNEDPETNESSALSVFDSSHLSLSSSAALQDTPSPAAAAAAHLKKNKRKTREQQQKRDKKKKLAAKKRRKTEHSAADDDGIAMYLALNRRHDELASSDDDFDAIKHKLYGPRANFSATTTKASITSSDTGTATFHMSSSSLSRTGRETFNKVHRPPQSLYSSRKYSSDTRNNYDPRGAYDEESAKDDDSEAERNVLEASHNNTTYSSRNSSNNRRPLNGWSLKSAANPQYHRLHQQQQQCYNAPRTSINTTTGGSATTIASFKPTHNVNDSEEEW